MKGELLFYSDFPFGFHNTEAEAKMARFAARGWQVTYVEQLGIRNPRPRHVLRALRARRSPSRAARTVPYDVVSPKDAEAPSLSEALASGILPKWDDARAHYASLDRKVG